MFIFIKVTFDFMLFLIKSKLTFFIDIDELVFF